MRRIYSILLTASISFPLCGGQIADATTLSAGSPVTF